MTDHSLIHVPTDVLADLLAAGVHSMVGDLLRLYQQPILDAHAGMEHADETTVGVYRIRYRENVRALTAALTTLEGFLYAR